MGGIYLGFSILGRVAFYLNKDNGWDSLVMDGIHLLIF